VLKRALSPYHNPTWWLHDFGEHDTLRNCSVGCCKKKVGRAALCTYIDFGLLLRRAFALHKIEKDSGRRNDTWKTWLQQHVRISEVEVRKLREMAALLAPYPGLRKLSLSYTEVYRRREQLSSLLESPGPYKDYWRQP